ncbi:MAG TPA: 2-C-methyl-D-erythritol 4-phosphate cytidylyltransferase [Bacteroidia bacterium]|nr:2-C-methyl-D-erythritol 4-phosphate cytidylyltransferase [Bacteroidia bacterium]HNT80775.1 2-C-methyl-D-erythritol 4-phosphate cytidylyltransferase [Bacteroidia bacterium]
MTKRNAIIVAGGSGSRMDTSVPKQFLLLKGFPLIYWSLHKFQQSNCALVLVIPSDFLDYYDHLVKKYHIHFPVQLCTGGDSRFESVQNGMKMIDNASTLTAIHDAARPFIKPSLIEQLFQVAEKKGNCIPLIDLKDSIRKVDGQQSSIAIREEFKMVQTPQVFRTEDLKRIYTNPILGTFSDDASLMERNGHCINFIEGDYTNIKITTPEDLVIAEKLAETLL